MNEEQWNLAGKRCLVTGATNGIGRATAMALAQQGAEVIVGGRSALRCAQVQEEIQAATGRSVECFICDFASLQGVRNVATAFAAKGEPLHVLINNAGIFPQRRVREFSPEGYELTFAVNHLAPFLLTGILLPRLLEAAPARIVNVSSDAHRYCKPKQFQDLQSTKSYGRFRAYGRSKACNLLFTRLLAERLGNDRVTVNAMHPGGVQTGLGGMDKRMGPVLRFLLGLVFRTPAQGADTVVWLAQEPTLQGSSGGYYANRRPHNARSYAVDLERAQKLWETSEELCDFRWPGLSGAEATQRTASTM